MMCLTVRVLLLSLWTLVAAAQTVVISDIDDTIKVSQVRDKAMAALRVFDTSSVFIGMPELYHLLEEQTQAKFYYVSNAPAFLVGSSHAKFLKANGFPEGPLLLKEGDVDTNKIRHLRRIIRTENPKTMILFGDNGERDIDVYDQVRREFPGIRFYSFIRTLYGRSEYPDLFALRQGQHSFVTPVEVVLNLASQNLLSEATARSIAEVHAHAFLISSANEFYGPQYRGSWMNFSESCLQVDPHFLESPVIKEYLDGVLGLQTDPACAMNNP